MTLTHIKTETCPDCQAEARVDRRDERTHTNGTRGESREFMCGAVLNYVPNLGRVETRRACPNTTAERAKLRKRADLYTAVMLAIETNAAGADTEYTHALTNAIRNYSP